MNIEISPKSTEIELNWEEANLYCQFLNINGVGWRLPTLIELNEIYLRENDFEQDWYWSNTPDNLFAINSGLKFIYYNICSYVRAVRDI